MINPLEYSNSISFTSHSNDDDVKEAVQVLTKRIKSSSPRTIKQAQSKIFYTAGVMRLVLNANLLYGITEGEIEVEKNDRTLVVHYVIRFYESFALSVIPAIGALVLIDTILGKIAGVFFVLGVIYGGNVLISILRYKRFIKNTIKDWLLEKKPVEISEEQKDWMSDQSKCDACGHPVSLNDTECPDCGLSLR
jgi:hypothetical protein